MVAAQASSNLLPAGKPRWIEGTEDPGAGRIGFDSACGIEHLRTAQVNPCLPSSM